MWIKLKEAPEFEVNGSGVFRNTLTGRLQSPHNGSYYPNIALRGSDGSFYTRQAHIVVAQYFLNNGKPIPKDKRVICLDDNPHNIHYSNLEIIDRNARISNKSKTTKPKEEFCVRYGDEIFC